MPNKMQVINKLPEIIKCIIYDHVSYDLNYQIEHSSDKFIGNPIDLIKCFYKCVTNYHINKLTGLKTPLHFIGLNCTQQLPPSQEILNKLQKFALKCDENSKIPNLPNIKELHINGNLIKIPNIIGLLELYFYRCINLTKIPNIVGLLKLDCHNCDGLIKIPNIKGLKELNCFSCDNLTEIPHIVGLKKLDCSYCDITEIPHIKGLLELNCNSCYNLTEIPHIVGLKKLDCSLCPKLTEIPNIVGLFIVKHFECEYD